MASGGGLGRVLGDGREDGGVDGRLDGGAWAGTVATAPGVDDTGLSTAVDGVAATVEGLTSAKGLGPKWLATRPQPVTTMITPATRATEVLARSTPS